MIQKKFIFSLSVLSLGFSALLSADNQQMSPSQKTTSATPVINPGFNVSGDFLYWYISEDSLDFSSISQKATYNGGPVLIDVVDAGVKFSWRPGFRVGLGYTFEHDHWDFDTIWTSIWGTFSGSQSNPNIAVQTQQPIDFIDSQFVRNMTWSHGKWVFNYNTVDFELGKCFAPSDFFMLRFHFGLRGAFIDQSFHISYLGGSVNDTQVTKWHLLQDYAGVAARSGFKANFYFNSDWSFWGKAAGALCWGHINEKVKTTPVSPGVETLLDYTKTSINRIRSNFEAGLGFQWETSYNQDKYHFAASVGYEIQDWQRMMIFRPGKDDLCLNGFTLSLLFDF